MIALINNAGISLVEPIADTSLAQWRRVFSVNVESVVLGLQAALPLLRESAYCASKGADHSAEQISRQEIRRAAIPDPCEQHSPGKRRDAMMDQILARYVELGLATSVEEQRAAWNANRRFRRMAQAEEITGGVVFLCSPAASFMTGAELVIDGGLRHEA